MKRLHIVWLVVFLLCLVFAGCSTDGDEIGNLFGTWKLTRFECPQEKVDFDTVFISFQGEAYEIQANWELLDAWGVYERTDDELHLMKLQYGGDFKVFHLDALEAKFHIDALSKKSLVLSRNDSIWYLKKFY